MALIFDLGFGCAGGGGSANITSLEVTPTTSAQTITASGSVDGYSPVNVSAVDSSIDANIVANNIKNGIEILGVTGNVIELNGETKTIIPRTYGQTLYPTAPKNGITQIDVAAVTSSIDANIVPGNIKKDVQILGVTGTYEGGSSGTSDVPLTRISDDNGNEIGTYFANFVDANGNKFKVVLLDQQYWSANLLWSSDTGAVTDMPVYNYSSRTFWYDTKETATENTQLILDWCSANGYTSSACEHCRAQSFTISGTTYYGQLPNMREVFDILRRFSDSIGINNLQLRSSTQNDGNYAWATLNSVNWSSVFYGDGRIDRVSKKAADYGLYSAPVLEIPF